MAVSLTITLPVEVDSHNSYPTDRMTLRRGTNRDDNVVISIGNDREIEVKMDDFKKAVAML